MGEIIRLLQFLRRLSADIPHSGKTMVFVGLAGVISGVSSTGLIALINRIINSEEGATAMLAWAFVGLCLALAVFRFCSQMLLFNLSQTTLLKLRLKLCRRILSAPLRQLEEIGAPKLLATLTNDIGQIVTSMPTVPLLVMNMALVLSSFAYLAYLSWELLLQTAVVVVVGFFSYQLAVRRAMRHLYASRRTTNEIFNYLRALTEGTKELKMHEGRSRAFISGIEDSTVRLQDQNRDGQMIFFIASSWGQVLFFVMVGVLVLVLPKFQPIDKEVLIGYVLVLFQMMAPLEMLLTTLPSLARSSVAMMTVEKLGLSLDVEIPETAGRAALPDPASARLELNGVVHEYRGENSSERFQLGPMDLTFEPGQVNFIVGGNGSGKTTLAKILLGLYAPEEGTLRFGSEAITDFNRDDYRQNFSAVFSDFFVFETLFGLDNVNLDDQARHYLEELNLESKVRVEDGKLSTVDLSQGQRKRLALLTAYLEDRPIYLFDEWAADQDPTFKEVFYLELLPQLKKRGKTVFVISHDDRYYHVADRIIRLDYGQVDPSWSAPIFDSEVPNEAS